MPTRLNIDGRTFGRMTVISTSGVDKRNRTVVLCSCRCGKTKEVLASNLQSGQTESCGCAKAEATRARRTTHGQSNKGDRLYEVWLHVRRRICSPHCKSYKDYGGRGLSMDPLWLGEDGFKRFQSDALALIGPHPGHGWTIDRIDNDCGYFLYHPVTGEPQLRWARHLLQAINKRKYTAKNRYRGVNLHKSGKYTAFIQRNRTRSYLGVFEDEDVAALTYDIEALKHQGSGAKLNFPHLLTKLQQYIDCEAALATL